VYVTNGLNTHGFLLRKGKFTTIDAPGASFPPPPTSGGTAATGINPQGDIVGDYTDSSDNIHGFLLRKGSFTTIDAPGSNFTSPSAINPRGDIVGFFVDDSGIHGFLLSHGAFSTIDVPGGTPGTTQALGIKPRGDIVGYYGDINDFTSNWLLSKGTFTAPITQALKPETCGCNGIPYAINPKGDIVGAYFDITGIHGFLLSKSQKSAWKRPITSQRSRARF